jgi:hypothetical protein
MTMRILRALSTATFLSCLALTGVAEAQTAARCPATKLAGAGVATRVRLDCAAINTLIGIPTDPCRVLSDVTLRQTWAVAESGGSCTGDLGAVRGDVDGYASEVIGIVGPGRRVLAATQLSAAGAAVQTFTSCGAVALLNGAPAVRCPGAGQAVLTSPFGGNPAKLLAVTGAYNRLTGGLDVRLGGILSLPTRTATATRTVTPTSTPTSTPAFNDTPTLTPTLVFTPTSTLTSTWTPTPTPTPTPTGGVPACGSFDQPCCQPGNVCFDGYVCGDGVTCTST